MKCYARYTVSVCNCTIRLQPALTYSYNILYPKSHDVAPLDDNSSLGVLMESTDTIGPPEPICILDGETCQVNQGIMVSRKMRKH